MAATDPPCSSILNSFKMIDVPVVMWQPCCTAILNYQNDRCLADGEQQYSKR